MNVVVTGASAGIGKQIVINMAKNPKNLIFAVARTVDEVCEFKSCKNIFPIVFDLNKDNYSLLMDTINTESKNKIHVLINNAGLLINKKLEEMDSSEIQSIYQTNVFGPMKLIKELLPSLKNRSKGAHIVNVSSMGGFQGSTKFDGLAVYSSSKSAIASLSECLSVELKQYKISVNALALGAVQTEMLTNAFPEYQAPLNAVQMAEFICWFSLNGNKFFNGKVIPVSLSTP